MAVALGFDVADLLSPLILGRSREDRLGASVARAAVPALALGAVGFVVFLAIHDLTSRP